MIKHLDLGFFISNVEIYFQEGYSVTIKWRTNDAQVSFNIKHPTPYMGSVSIFGGFIPHLWGGQRGHLPLAGGLELPNQRTVGTSLNHLIHSQVLCY
jgi:hypothetical protein